MNIGQHALLIMALESEAKVQLANKAPKPKKKPVSKNQIKFKESLKEIKQDIKAGLTTPKLAYKYGFTRTTMQNYMDRFLDDELLKQLKRNGRVQSSQGVTTANTVRRKKTINRDFVA